MGSTTGLVATGFHWEGWDGGWVTLEFQQFLVSAGSCPPPRCHHTAPAGHGGGKNVGSWKNWLWMRLGMATVTPRSSRALGPAWRLQRQRIRAREGRTSAVEGEAHSGIHGERGYL